MKGSILRLRKEERNLIKTAISEYITSLNFGQVGQYQMAAQYLEDKDLYVDGIIMRCFENSLRFKGNKDSSSIPIRLAEYIKQQRENFQLQAMSRLGLAAI
jgi:hypothetical protein